MIDMNWLLGGYVKLIFCFFFLVEFYIILVMFIGVDY